MILGVLSIFLLTSGIETLQCSLGVPVTIDYSIPEGYVPRPFEVTDDFVLLEQRGDSITIIPMVLDTLILPPVYAVSDTLEVEKEFPPPVVVVTRTIPDTTWIVPVFPAPLVHTIPPGLPQDYLHRHSFWERWGRTPSNGLLLPLILSVAAVLTALLVWFIHRRRNKLPSVDDPSVFRKSLSPLDEVQALLNSKAFVEGRWPEYYMDVDRLLRDTVAIRFGISSRAYTWRQIRRQLAKEKNGRKFTNNAAELTREITLQRYASWGGSRERARKFTSKLLTLREEWHRQ
ncbi:MAG: hypothetical protein GQ565_07840 [Candidatus Aegiribacteria sp.]|nr:hypothetical protein [Candidatus Aegiribacteria sp.]